MNSIKRPYELLRIFQQLAQNMELEKEDKQSVERFLQQLNECQEECCIIATKCCSLLNEGPLS